MKLGIYGKSFDNKDLDTISYLFNLLTGMDISYCIEKNYYDKIQDKITLQYHETFSDAKELRTSNINFLLCLGGDGTLLETLAFVKKSTIPVIGINLGRLGFLSQVPKNAIGEALNSIQNGHFRLERRSVLELKSEDGLFKPFNFALNDFTIHKRDTGSMISIDTYLNGDYFNTYWADGIIVSTPTGSTAYSLSCGGPIIFPDSNNFVITPVAPHNLNIRPIIVSDTTVISFRVKGRGTNHLVSLDARYEIIEHIKEIAIQKADFLLNLIKLNNQNFIITLRDKLKWGLDPRNL
jgi:NAD+ kinase